MPHYAHKLVTDLVRLLLGAVQLACRKLKNIFAAADTGGFLPSPKSVFGGLF